MVRVRETTAIDGDQLRQIQQAVLAEPWPELLDTALGGFPPLFVVSDSDPIGYAIVIPGPEETAYVPELAIAPDRQREGHGSALLDYIGETQQTAGYSKLALSVRVADDGAREFYLENGFEVVERLPDEFESGAGLLLVRELS